MKETFSYTYDDLFNPTLKALHKLGGSGTVDEIEHEVALMLNLTGEQINEIHRAKTSKLTYRLAWSRNYLKRFGLLENTSRGNWSLTEKGLKATSVDEGQVKRTVAEEFRNANADRLSKKIPTFESTLNLDSNMAKEEIRSEMINIIETENELFEEKDEKES